MKLVVAGIPSKKLGEVLVSRYMARRPTCTFAQSKLAIKVDEPKKRKVKVNADPETATARFSKHRAAAVAGSAVEASGNEAAASPQGTCRGAAVTSPGGRARGPQSKRSRKPVQRK